MKILKEILNHSGISRTICIYPGRFQPFCPHHLLAYQHLCNKFGIDNVFVAISDNELDAERNPFDVELRRDICRKYGIRNITSVSSPYRPIEITRNYDPNTTALVLAVGSKDYSNKLCDNDVFGTKYYARYGEPLIPFRSKGFIYIIPAIEVDNKLASATDIRINLKSNISFEQLGDIFGWVDEDIFQRMRSKLNASSQISFRKRILHVWEHDISFSDLFELIDNLLRGKIYNVTEKIDGQHLLFSVKNGQAVYAKTSSKLDNPEPSEEFLKKINLAAFSMYSNVCSELDFILKNINEQDFFQNGNRFLSVEIVDPALTNVIMYDHHSYIFLHNLIPEDPQMLEQFYVKSKDLFSRYKLSMPRIVILNGIYNCNSISKSLILEAKKIMNVHNLSDRDNIQKLSTMGKIELEVLIGRLGNLILDEIDLSLCKSKYSCIQNIKNQINATIRQIESGSDREKMKKLSDNMEKLQRIGGIDSVNSIEGIVFDYNGKKMKMTGSFRYINQIIAMNKYSQ